MLILERQRKAIDNRAEDFEELCNAIVALRFIDEAVKHIADRLADKSAVRHELAC